MRINHVIGMSGLLVAMTMLVTGTAQAAPTYCVPGPNTDGLDVSDVVFEGATANDCYGIVDSPNLFLADINALTNWGGGFALVLKDNGPPGTVSFLGLTWTLDAPNSGTSGMWTLTLEDPAPPGFPVTVDIVVGLKAATSWAAYLFVAQTFIFEDTYDGSFVVKLQVPGPSGNLADLSHMSIFLRQAGNVTIPEPGVLALLGLGLVAVGVRLRKRA